MMTHPISLNAESKTGHPPCPWWFYLGWCIPVACGFAIAFQFHRAAFGLPIDDAYIYVQYMENIAQGEGYSFNPGEISFGVTSFLFTILGAIILKVLPGTEAVAICQGLSILSYLFLLWFVQRIVHRLTHNYLLSWITGCLLAVCRPLYFTAPSGLETTLFLATASGVIWLGIRNPRPNLVWMGIGCALLYLSRPEGLYFALAFLASLALYPLWFEPARVYREWKQMASRVLYFGAGLSLVSLPYLSFVKWSSGQWMPMTFYGKLLNRSTFLQEPWYEKIKSGLLALTEGYQQMIAQDPMPFTFGLLTGLSLFSFTLFILQCGRQKPHPFGFAVRMAMFAFFAFPFIYGVAFRTSPLFGGYFVRYIQILIVMIFIEGAVGCHALFCTLAPLWPKETQRRGFVTACTFLLFPVVILTARVDLKQWDVDIQFYQDHVKVNERVRKSAAQWIAQNTEPDARIMTSNSGLGALGAYCDRFVRDEAGLISSDIYPFLAGYSQGFNHWHKILEYMKELDIDYYTTFPPYGAETRHSKTVAEIEEPSLKGTKLERLMKIRITRFIAPEIFDLWMDYEQEATFIDRGLQPITANRVNLTHWKEKPVIALQTLADQGDIRYRMIFPSHARFTAGIAFESDHTYGPEDTATIEIKVHYGGELIPVYSKTYSLQNIETHTLVDTLDVDLAPFSKKFAFLLFGARTSGPHIDGLWIGWIMPQLISRAE